MTKQEFLTQLGEKLSAMPERERNGIVDYYDSHIQASNDGDEADIIAKLGSPSDVAAEVLAAYVKKMETKSVPPHPQKPDFKRPSYWWAVVVLLIIFSPAIIGLTVGLGGGVIGLGAGVFSVVVAFAATGVSFIGVGLASAALSIPIFFSDAGFGLLSLGIGFVLVGCGILLIKLTILIAKWMISLVQMIIEKIFGRGRRHEHGRAI